MKSNEIHSWEDDLETRRVGQERREEVLLCPIPAVLREPEFRIVERQPDVVNMDNNAGSQTRQYLAVFRHYVATTSHNVRGINEQDVVWTKRIEHG